MTDQPDNGGRGPRRVMGGGVLLLLVMIVAYCATRDHDTPRANETAPVNAVR